ncbi:MAG: TetR/AcrR family transcriptional regulator [Desulfobacterales bacterium]|nr:TetR/AcrR family transcriptional regulator [Desulfobacterales bacterium]
MAFKDTRRILLNAATNLFYQKGYPNTTIREIGQKAGISNSIIYHYFKNKEEMLFEIIQVAAKDLVNALVEIQQEVEDPVECLKEMLTSHMVVWCLNRKRESKIIVADDYWLTGKRREANRIIQRQIYRLYIDKLEELHENRLLEHIDLKVLAFTIFGAINSFFRWYREGGSLSKEDVAQNVIAIVFNGILKDKKYG